MDYLNRTPFEVNDEELPASRAISSRAVVNDLAQLWLPYQETGE
jgi:hypothetical protein